MAMRTMRAIGKDKCARCRERAAPMKEQFLDAPDDYQ